MTINERLQEAFDKRVCGTAMLPASELLSAMSAIEQLEETIAQQAEAIRLKDVALRVAQLYLDGNCHSHKTVSSALAVQPSPEILQTRDEQVAEACAKIVNPSSLTYITRGDALTAIRSNEWRKYL